MKNRLITIASIVGVALCAHAYGESVPTPGILTVAADVAFKVATVADYDKFELTSSNRGLPISGQAPSTGNRRRS